MKTTALLRPFLFAAAIAALPLVGLAQPAALAPGQISGAELQAWIDADGMALGGVNVTNGCTFMVKGAPKRYQTVHCPGVSEPFTVVGEMKVAGNQACAKFVYPDGSKLEACQDAFKVGDNKYEFRVGGTTRTVFYRLMR